MKRRYRLEKRFRFYGIAAILIALFFLGALLWSVVSKGYTAFWQTTLTLPIYFDTQILDPENERAQDPDFLMTANYRALIAHTLAQKLGIDENDRKAMRQIRKFYSSSASVVLRDMVVENPKILNTTQTVTILAASDVDSVFKGEIDVSIDESRRKVSDLQVSWVNRLKQQGILKKSFNKWLFLSPASSVPEKSGLAVALLGSLYMMLIVLCLAMPIGVGAAIYLEEYAKKNWFSHILEVNINNLAAVPSIVFGLLGLSVFINFFGMPRSASIVGGLVLTLMTLPTIIITTRAALRSVPPSIRSAALGLGASKTQMIFHHVLPLSLPTILTGVIIGLAQALGETAPLLLIGMVAFVGNVPLSVFDPATALPVQIYSWANEVERGFVERTSAAIIVLLLFLAIMNITAIFLRRRFEKRW